MAGDSTSREIFFGLSHQVAPGFKLRGILDHHWKVGRGRSETNAQLHSKLEMHLLRNHYAPELSHSLDSVYYNQIIRKQFSNKDRVRHQRQSSISSMCKQEPNTKRFMACLKVVPNVVVANVALWEPRRWTGTYSLYGSDVRSRFSCIHN
jgi:hypothetical protein